MVWGNDKIDRSLDCARDDSGAIAMTKGCDWDKFLSFCCVRDDIIVEYQKLNIV